LSSNSVINKNVPQVKVSPGGASFLLTGPGVVLIIVAAMRIPLVDRSYRSLKRYREIVGVLFRYGFGEVLGRMNITRYLRIGRRRPIGVEVVEKHSFYQRIRMALEELGPTFVKMGQVMSTRPFLIPIDLVIELTRLQDRVPPMDFETAKQIVESELGADLSAIFSEFDSEPLASASLSQVHRAVLVDGTEVAVKVQRPDIKKVIEADMEILKDLANLMERYIPESRQYDPSGLVSELAKTTRLEIDFINEARNIDIFRSNFQGDRSIFIPQVFWKQTTSRVLTMEFIRGVKISEQEELSKLGLDPEAICRNLGRIVFKQVFEDGFFHADPHPGNLFVLEGNVVAPVDYGMVGKLSQTAMEDISGTLVAAIDQDPRAVIRVLQNAGAVGDEVDLKLLEQDLTDYLYRYHKVPLRQINMREVTEDFFEVMHRYDIKVQSQFMLLVKALVTFEEVARLLDPDYDAATEAAPYVRKLAMRKYRPGILLKDIRSILAELRDFATLFPYELRRIFLKLKQGELSFDLQHRGLDRLINEMDRASNRLSMAMIVAAIIVGSSLIIRSDIGYMIFGFPLIGIIGYLFAGFLGVWLVIGILRSRRF
jgi:ubiquinone biosynthesis protein